MNIPRTFHLPRSLPLRDGTVVAALALTAGIMACSDQEPTASRPPSAPPTASVEASGPGGDAGVGIATSSQLWAVLDQNGFLLRGKGVTGVSHLGIGRYEVTFNRDLSRCAYVATTNNAYSQALTIFTASGHLSARGVYVETKNQGGGLTDGPFNLVVTCGNTGIRYAVVGYSANLVRATSGTTLQYLGAGRYNVTFPTTVSGCAYVATVGDPGRALVFSPSGVYTGSGPNGRTVYIETKNPGGGLQDGVPFHLAVICPSTSASRIAVVRADGTGQRFSASTSSFRWGTGQYVIQSNRNLAVCAAVATRGSENRAVPFNPATVEIVPGPNVNSIGIQVRALLFFGGAFSDQSFHAAMVC